MNGEYCTRWQTVDLKGRMTPENLNFEPVSQRVIGRHDDAGAAGAADGAGGWRLRVALHGIGCEPRT